MLSLPIEAMAERRLTVERAKELARSGDYQNAGHIRLQLTCEGYVDAAAQLSKPKLRAELNGVCRAAVKLSVRNEG
ncbi:MAG: hypothetical protein ACYDD1_19945 [Caulobacteraceae bacterium]